jgi:UDP:flavonoid glycosyltransferase YjiC (YdhE family)
MGRRIEALGAGLITKQTSKEEDYAALLTQLLETPCYRQAAQAFANRHVGFKAEQEVSQASLLIENVLKDAIVDLKINHIFPTPGHGYYKINTDTGIF